MGTQALLIAVAAPALTVANPTAIAPVNGQAYAVPGTAGYDITWDLLAAGTALATMQIDLQGSLDAAFTNPIQLDTTNVVGSFGRHITNKTVPFLRVRLVSASGGDATSGLAARVYVKKRGADL